MQYEMPTSEAGVQIHLMGQLTFDTHLEFREIIEGLVLSQTKNISLDISGLDGMDSAGLGLLLLMREKAEELGATFQLFGPRGQVKDLLTVSRFDVLIPISAGSL